MKKQILTGLLCALFSISVFAEQMPADFYASVDGLQDAQLKVALKNLIVNHTNITYGSGIGHTWEVFYYSDRDSNGYCMDMYCDDWKILNHPGDVAAGCNIEHSMANSWWGGSKTPPYNDCYHLNPSNAQANSARSNYPLGVPEKNIKTAGSLRIGQIHHETLNVDFNVFEPKDEYKGDFARAYLYMATCYGQDANGGYPDLPKNNKKPYAGWRIDNSDVGSKFAMRNDSYLEFQPWEQAVLIAWHRMDPVSEKEIKRADAVSDFQHNRNPFIDYPYLAEYIWGEKAGQALDMRHLISSTDSLFVPGVSNGWIEEIPQSMDHQSANRQSTHRKLLIDGQVYILVGEQRYTIMGQKVR